MNIKPIKNQKTLTPNEEIVKELLTKLLVLYTNLAKLKEAKPQRQLVGSIINALRNKKRTFTYIDLFNMLLWLMKTVKGKENIAISSRLFILVKDSYKQTLK